MMKLIRKELMRSSTGGYTPGQIHLLSRLVICAVVVLSMGTLFLATLESLCVPVGCALEDLLHFHRYGHGP